MTRNRWTGLAGILYAIGFFSMTFIVPSTPDTGNSDAVQKYADFWSKSSHQSRATVGAMVLTYLFLLLVAFAAGLRDRLRAVDAGPLPSLVLAAGAVAATLILVGGEASFAVGLTGDQAKTFTVDGKTAMIFDNLGYQLLAPGLMAAAVMAVATGIVTLRTRVLPVWTAWLGFLLGLACVGSFFSAWTAFIGLPLWTAVISVVLLLRAEPGVAARVPVEQREPVSA
jgi:hypothetical protein